ncbi:hypothetical protein, partial [Staphylococcus aureus]|uniref:hypothetical protein n=1 Tax=Staphylococcus aureus TaxID=1280 RepID=UPI0021B2299E
MHLNNFHYIKIPFPSPQKIPSSSFPQLKKPQTINYPTLKPQKHPLFCETIFGPTRDSESSSG